MTYFISSKFPLAQQIGCRAKVEISGKATSEKFFHNHCREFLKTRWRVERQGRKQ